LGVPVIVVVFGAVNHRVLRVKEYRVELPRRASAARDMTIVFMADLHFRDLTSDRFLEELAAKVDAQKPDLILLGGDLLEGDRRGEDTGRYERAFRAMTTTYGIYGAPGNHERFSRVGAGAFLARAGIRLLQDEAGHRRRPVLAGGRTPVATGSRPPRFRPAPRPARRPDRAPPTGFDEARLAGVDIQLSGHTHHGQLFPVNLITSGQYDLSWGHLERDGAHLFVTSGVQGW
jgi:predicted MPP superfamily phosphohydrolase